MAHSSTTASQGSSVFDRLYSKSTESSRIRKTTGPVTNQNFLTRDDDDKHHGSSSTTKPRPKTGPKGNRVVAPTTTTTIPASGGVHDRLYSKGTASYNSKRKAASSTSPSKSHEQHPRGPLKTKTNS
mmetsp:Transcript_21012/g.33818  ORF Transcript_21012/g.33818 Transcript_21012/m.33818 type:complete len:127 (+) Transcript_21012:71-451(+)